MKYRKRRLIRMLVEAEGFRRELAERLEQSRALTIVEQADDEI